MFVFQGEHIKSAAMVVVVIGIVASSGLLAQERPAGTVLDERISKDVTIRFHYCSAGSHRPGDPRLNRPAALLRTGFFLSEAEVSQDQYRLVMGEEALKKVKARVDKIGLRPSVEPGSRSVSQSYFRGASSGKLPVFGLTFDEAVEFCRKCETQIAREAGLSDKIEKVQIRLPSTLEWEYACRGGTPNPHVYRWIEKDWRTLEYLRPGEPGTFLISEIIDQPKSGLYKAWEMALSGKPPRRFSGSQDDFVALAESNQQDGRSAFASVLADAIGIKAVSIATTGGEKGNLLPTDTILPLSTNSWGLRNLSTNVAEWTYLSESFEAARADWQNLSTGSVENNQAIPFGVMGGNTFSAEWKEFLIWYFTPIDAQEMGSDEQVAARAVGIRLLLQVSRTPTWLVEVRLLSKSPKNLAQLTSVRDRIADPSLGQVDATDKARVEFYLALAKYSAGNYSEASKTLKAQETIIKTDDFFGQIAGLMSEDGRP